MNDLKRALLINLSVCFPSLSSYPLMFLSSTSHSPLPTSHTLSLPLSDVSLLSGHLGEGLV